MRSDNSETVAAIALEIAWLLGSWAISFGVVGVIFGFSRLLAGPLDIQLHNSYFVLSAGYAIFPVFVFVATVVTAARGALARFGQARINTVLGLLGIVWVFVLLLLFTLLRGAR